MVDSECSTDDCKSPEISIGAIMKNPEMLKFVTDHLKTKKIPDWYKTQEMCHIIIYKDPFMLIYCPNIYKTQRMCDETVDDCLAALKVISDWFVTWKMPEKFHQGIKFLVNNRFVYTSFMQCLL